jgi:ketosteroid isomerase-like protein
MQSDDRLHWRDQITALEDEARRAFVTRDVDRLAALFSDELLVNSPINRVHGKRQVLELLQAGTIAHVSLTGEIETIERRGDLVIVMGRESVVDAPEQPELRRRYTNVWRAEGESWRLLVRHANVTPAHR